MGKYPKTNSVSEFLFSAGNEMFPTEIPFAVTVNEVGVKAAEAAVSMILTGDVASKLGKVKSNSCSFLTSNDSPSH